MGVPVLKFGGSSVADAEMMDRAAGIVADAAPCVVVTSAVDGVTDALVDHLPEIVDDEDVVAPLLSKLRDRHHDAVAGLPAGLRQVAEAEIDEQVQKLERVLYGIAYTRELTDKTRDLALSFGERLAARALAAHVRAAGLDAEAIDADQAGIVTDAQYGNANPLMPEVEENVPATLGPRLDDDQIPVVTGFFGATVDGHVATFGRGGSDFTGAILAAALDADRLDVWTDVDGFLTTDPELLDRARPVPEMGYEEAAELAYMGLQVLHPRTVEPLADRGIPLHVRNTRQPDADGTRIHAVDPESGTVRAVALRSGLGIVKLYGPGMAATPGVGARVFEALGEHGINVHNMAASQASFALLVDADDLRQARRVLEETDLGIVQDVDTSDGKSLVCVVGPDLGGVPGIAGRILTAVGEGAVNVEMISVGASHIAMNFVVNTDQEREALETLHDEFMG